MTTEVSKLEFQQERNKHQIALRDAAVSLNKNRDFKRLIIDAFMGVECARYAQLSGDPALSAAERADALALAQAAGHLKRFISVTIRLGDNAEDDNKAISEEIDEIRQNGEDA